LLSSIRYLKTTSYIGLANSMIAPVFLTDEI